jgi:hypothetical protein
MTMNMNLTSDHDGETESGKFVPAGTTVKYDGHLPGGAIKVIFQDGSEEIMSPSCFPTLR